MTRLGAALGAGLIAGASLAAEAPTTVPTPPPAAIDPATGERVPLDFTAGPMHVMFIATWCQPCVDEIPKLFDLEDRWKSDGYRLFLVAVSTRQTAERLKSFGTAHPHPGRLLFDADGTVAPSFGASNIPAHVLVDRRGAVVRRAGAIDAAFKSAVERLVRQEGRAPSS